MKFRSILLSSILSLTLAAGGCKKGSSTTSTTPGAAAKPRVALVMKSLANEFFKTMQDGAEAQHNAHAADYDLISTGIKTELDVDEQIALVEQMIAQHVDAIVLAPADSKALVPACKKAADAGIIVVNIDNKLDADALKEKSLTIPFVGPNNMKGAKLAGDYLAKHLSKGDPVAIIDGQPGAFNAIQRHAGFESAMTEAGMNIVTSQSAGWETDKATPLVSSILSSHPDIKAFLCANDSMCLGAHTALKDAKKIGSIQLIGFDNIAAVQSLVKSGEVLCTVDQHADQIAAKGVDYALQILKTHAAPADQETPVDLVTAESLKH
ncbi:MAG TPA: sugar ABC transporter substrate-binding protein [Tepidisphaeraceae bacterium]|jgi:ribose transport system substrate-binding protein|nr:sugar ABC transporter substrate-binding protein [Tepidisphaeraceae bacterium]